MIKQNHAHHTFYDIITSTHALHLQLQWNVSNQRKNNDSMEDVKDFSIEKQQKPQLQCTIINEKEKNRVDWERETMQQGTR